MGKDKPFTVRIHVRVGDGEYRDWDTLSKAEQKYLGVMLNDKALRAIGYAPVDEAAFQRYVKELKESVNSDELNN